MAAEGSVLIRALREDDDRESFRSGNASLDEFFRRYAGQNQFRHHIGVTYVAALGALVLGYATVSPAALDADELPSGKRMPPYPLPVLRLARLAVAESAAGRGLGRALLRFTIELAERQRDEVGCVGVLVDAKPDAVEFYLQFGFVRVEAVAGIAQTTPRAIALYLPLGSVPRRAR
jgi:GNAT superfamily N-acetyltransferase